MTGAPDTQAEEEIEAARPALAGHGFTETVKAPSPFVRSFIRNQIGMGKISGLSTLLPDFDGSEIVGLPGSVYNALIEFEYQYAIKPWIAARVDLSLAGRLGSDTYALLSEGITMSAGYGFGWLIRLHERDKTVLSLDLGIVSRDVTGVNITQFVEDIINDRPASLVQKTPSMRSAGGLRFGWAVSRLVGLVGGAWLGYGESLDRSEGDVFFQKYSVAADFDFDRNASLPLGLALGYQYDTYPKVESNDNNGAHGTFLRVSYVGRQDFLFSLDMTWELLPVDGDNSDLKSATITISMRYYL